MPLAGDLRLRFEVRQMDRIRFNLNGEWVEETSVSPTMTLLRYLRDVRGLTATKEGCAEGDCGACTVAVVEAGLDGKPAWRAVNSCLLLLPMLQGKHVVTAEALAHDGEHHPAQESMARHLGSQCGYCTPGVVMSLFEAAYRNDLDAPWKLDDQLCGNLCRCTGYRPIRAAADEVAGSCPKDGFSQLDVRKPQDMGLGYRAKDQRFFTPTTDAELWDVLDENPDARLVVGGTDLSLEVTKRHARPPCLVSLEGLKALRGVGESKDGFLLGAAVTIAELEDFTQYRLPPVHRMARYFGARQIKHRGTVGGNLCNASPIGDLPPVFLSLDAQVVLASRKGERRLPLVDFFTGYRKTALAPKEILAAVVVPPLAATTRAVAYKVSKRRELDISTVSAGFAVDVGDDGLVTRARLAYGGMADRPKRAALAEAALVGKLWNEETVAAAAAKLKDDFTPLSDHRGSAKYRSAVAANLLRGFFEETREVRQPALQPGHAATVQAPHQRSAPDA
jgi:xanthine dehydrogenase small subunit